MTEGTTMPEEREAIVAVCANCEGMIGDLAPGRDPEELCDTCYEDIQAAAAIKRDHHLKESTHE